MDERSLEILEFPAIRARLAELTSFGPARRLAEALLPSPDPVVVARGLDETDQARALRVERPEVGIGGAVDIGPAIERAARGGRLEPSQFLAIGETLDAAARVATQLADDRRPLLRDLARRLHGLPALRATLARSFDPAGELLDTASPRLGSLRAAVRVAYERLRRRLDQLVASELGSALQEPIVTLRNGRYVVPIRAEARSRVRGIVHDASSSGQTLFVEPLVIVELGNAWREAQAAEAEEVERILDELSALVGAHAPLLRETLDALATLDFWLAKARLAELLDAVRPDPSDDGTLGLRSARHPGLGAAAVPIDVRLGGEFQALVITGPNTGGKTVALRTIGLLALMHQAGLHVPAAVGSRLPVFRDVCADIGDEQSIAQSLSTFSGHLRRIIGILERAGPGTLVLLDELGAGTDPTEGAALAQAILDHLLAAGALVAASTHSAALKVYAHTTPGVRNAAVEFDLETLRPTYRLSIGLPGASQAFAIAERLGLDPAIVSAARSRLTDDERAFEATLARIRETEREVAAALDAARRAEERAAEALRAAEEERRRAKAEREALLAATRTEAEALVERLRSELAAARRALERETLTVPRIDEQIARAEAVLADLPAGSKATDPAATWRVGDWARSRRGDWEGRIVAFDRSHRRVRLEAGGKRISAAVADLVPAGPSDSSRPTPTARRARDAVSTATTPSRLGLDRARRVASSLDLRGARVEDAVALLERYIEDASLAGLHEVTIVHGVGTGALRDVVRATAADHPLVAAVRGGSAGEGVTILTL